MSWPTLPMCAHRRRTGCAQFVTFIIPLQHHSTGANRLTRADTTQSSFVTKASEELSTVDGIDEAFGENIDRPVPATTGLPVRQRTVTNVRDVAGYGYGICNLVFPL